MRIIVDMCLPPALCEVLKDAGHDARHWTATGHPKAMDLEIMRWALENSAVVITHDLDFGDMLALTAAAGPSVIIIREEDVSSEHISGPVLRVLQQFADELERGSLISMTCVLARTRALPLR